jgi:hypothetical protein
MMKRWNDGTMTKRKRENQKIRKSEKAKHG